eukprot:s425_g10.t1
MPFVSSSSLHSFLTHSLRYAHPVTYHASSPSYLLRSFPLGSLPTSLLSPTAYYVEPSLTKEQRNDD